MSTTAIADPNTFLAGVFVSDVDGGQLVPDDRSIGSVADSVLENRRPVIHRQDESVCLGFPVFCDGDLRSVIQFVGKTDQGISGVFEVWEPSGLYQDLKLTSGYFAHLERFQNVSSFVRFETGSGLPGQAAAAAKAIVHDDLKQHPGFLRAAGASAGELQTALALPVFCPDFLCTVVLISSLPTPLARCIEIWKPANETSELEHISAPDTQFDGVMQDPGTVSTLDGLLAEVTSRQTAVLCTDTDQLSATCIHGDRPSDSALAIPTYRGSQLNSISLIWL